MKTVEIEVKDDGTVLVGSPPQSEETGTEDMQADKEYLSPAKSVDDALDVARDLLTGNTAEQAAQSESEMQVGYSTVRPGAE